MKYKGPYFRQNPATPTAPGALKNPYENFSPDLIVTISVETSTGRTALHTNKPVAPLQMIILATDIIRGNVQMIAAQDRMIIKPGLSKSDLLDDRPRSTSECPGFLACTDNAEICQHCGCHEGNHESNGAVS